MVLTQSCWSPISWGFSEQHSLCRQLLEADSPSLLREGGCWDQVQLQAPGSLPARDVRGGASGSILAEDRNGAELGKFADVRSVWKIGKGGCSSIHSSSSW